MDASGRLGKILLGMNRALGESESTGRISVSRDDHVYLELILMTSPAHCQIRSSLCTPWPTHMIYKLTACSGLVLRMVNRTHTSLYRSSRPSGVQVP